MVRDNILNRVFLFASYLFVSINNIGLLANIEPVFDFKFMQFAPSLKKKKEKKRLQS